MGYEVSRYIEREVYDLGCSLVQGLHICSCSEKIVWRSYLGQIAQSHSGNLRSMRTLKTWPPIRLSGSCVSIG